VEWNARKVIAKLFRQPGHVQLIVFVAAIREILKREIYSGDKRSFWLVKTKAQAMPPKKFRNKSQMQAIRFVNAGQPGPGTKLRRWWSGYSREDCSRAVLASWFGFGFPR